MADPSVRSKRKRRPSVHEEATPPPPPPPPPKNILADWALQAGLSESERDALVTWLAKQMVSDQFAKLEQGSYHEGGIPLRKVFVDLPITTQYGQMHYDDGSRQCVIRTLLESSPVSLCDVPKRNEPDDALWELIEPPFSLSSGILLIGGPGQGKSTVGQLACQLHRAALLEPFLNQLLPAQRSVVRSFTDPSAKDDIGQPSSPLFPVRIVLPEAASWLTQQEPRTNDQPAQILQFLAAQATARSADLSPEAFWKLLSNAPFLLVLDALDEVGDPQDRGKLIAAIAAFLKALRDGAPQGIVLATTRPQGYSGELQSLGVPLVTAYLAPLLRDEAIAYGDKLAEAKYGADSDEYRRIKDRLEQAVDDQTTQGLLTTPLQVTIVTALILRLGRVPGERWALFEKYFETVYDRELERGTYAASLLRDHKKHILQIHTRVALLLHVESEHSGSAEARMPRARLESIADLVLADDGFDDETRAALVRRIVRAAEERLVFLVEPEPGEFGFEIRSFQEFMAAWALANANDSLVEARLNQIVKAPTFRAVALFLASKIFSEGLSLREVFAERVCAAIEEGTDGDALRAVRAGALFALETLEEGSVRTQPKYARQLMKRACGLLDLPPSNEQRRLARVQAQGATIELQRELPERLRNSSPGKTLGAWVALTEAAGRGDAWADKVGLDAWADPKLSIPLLAAWRASGGSLNGWIARRVEDSPDKVQPSWIQLWGRSKITTTDTGWMHRFRTFIDSRVQFRTTLSGRGVGLEYITLRLPAGDACRAFIDALPDPPAQWRPWVLVAEFTEQPSAQLLAKSVRGLAERPAWGQRGALATVCPWPLAACLRCADSPADLLSYAAMAEAGKLGDLQDWLSAEGAWPNRPHVGTFFESAGQQAPWALPTLQTAPPCSGVEFRFSVNSYDPKILQWFRASLQSIQSSSLKRHVATALMTWLARNHQSHQEDDIPWTDVERWMESAECVSTSLLPAAPYLPHVDERLRVLNRLAHRSGLIRGISEDASWRSVMLMQFYSKHPELSGLLYWIRLLLLTARRRTEAESDESRIPATVREEFLRALNEHPISDPALRADSALIRVGLGSVEADEVANLVDAVGTPPNPPWAALVELAQSHSLARRTREALVTTLLQRSNVPPGAASLAVSVLRGAFSSHRSGLSDPAAWRRLDLPAPFPTVRSAYEHGSAPPEAPVALSRIHLQYIRGIAEVTLDLAPPAAPDEGQWVVLLGPNGVGKTTLLRALAVALRNHSNPRIWPKGTFETQWCSNGAPPGKTVISVQLADGNAFTATAHKNGAERFTQAPDDSSAPFPIFAYGCRRGSALGGAAQKVDISGDDGPEIATLFSEEASLIHAETWLKEWDGAAARSPEKHGVVYETVRRALRELLDVDEVVVRDRQVFVSGTSVGVDVPFAALSDGYLTTAGWFLDLVARWIELAQKHLSGRDSSILGRMTGLVLLDELDLHLHPRWQIDVIPRIKKLLPKMSFIVTTHNPLTLVGARPEEIWILSTRGGRVRAEQGLEAPMLLTGGQIYSRYFGITDVYPHELGEALRRYGFLSGDPRRTDEEQLEMESLRTKLKAQGVEPGWEEVPREAPPPTRPKRRASRPKAART